MKARDVIRDIMKSSGVTNATLAHRMNMSIAATWDLIGKEKNQFDMRTSKLTPALTALDYKLVAIPRDEKVPKGGYVID